LNLTLSPVAYLETSVIYCAENKNKLAQFPSECVDLIYLDPPFFSNRAYEVIWGDEAEVRSFADRWEGGIEVYVEWMRERVLQMHRLLKPTGSLYLHCDTAAGHYLKVMLDEMFGRRNFRNEIIWRRTGSNSAAKRFGPLHQSIYFYTKTRAAPFYPVFGPYTKGYVRDYFKGEDERGRYRPVLLTGSGRRNGESGQPWRHYDPTSSNRHWAIPAYLVTKYKEATGEPLGDGSLVEKLERLDAAGLIHWGQKADSVPNYKYYLADAPGVPLQDVWAYQPGTEGCVYGNEDDGIDQDVKWLGTKDGELQGYPTQKPEGVLERIIKASSRPGDVVLDPFCGCGTTIAVAERLGRQWIGVDISPTAVRVMRRRLNRQKSFDFRVDGLPETEDALWKLAPLEFQNWVIDVLHGTHAPPAKDALGVDGYSFLERLPIQVKQKKKVDRTVVDAFQAAMRREKKHKGYIVAFSFTKRAHAEAARVKSDGLEIGLVKVATLLDNPPERPLRPGLNTLVADLLNSAREAAQRGVATTAATRQRSVEELIESQASVG
jgi:DNA modification methylase